MFEYFAKGPHGDGDDVNGYAAYCRPYRPNSDNERAFMDPFPIRGWRRKRQEPRRSDGVVCPPPTGNGAHYEVTCVAPYVWRRRKVAGTQATVA